MCRQTTLPINQMPLGQILPYEFENTVRECCEAAQSCCDNKLQYDHKSTHIGQCPATWDGWTCFEQSKPGIVRATCPDYAFGQRWYQKNNENAVIKTCNSNGQWDGIIRNENVFKERTNYLGCHREESWLKPMLIATFVIHCLSALALLPALIVISCNR